MTVALDRPRLALGSFPTPLERAERLGRDLGVRLAVKREDLSGLLLGGNKVRKLELLLASEPYAAADVWITVGGIQSNHARETAAAAARQGRRCVLVLAGDPPAEPANGNLLLFELLGAELRFAGADADAAAVARVVEQVAGELARDGLTAAAIPVGAAHPLGVVAWAEGMAEALGQLDALGERVDHVVLSAGTGSTAAGCALALAERQLDVPVCGRLGQLGRRAARGRGRRAAAGRCHRRRRRRPRRAPPALGRAADRAGLHRRDAGRPLGAAAACRRGG